MFLKYFQDVQAVGVLEQGLCREGWSSSLDLPLGWKYRLTMGKIQYLTSSYELVASHGRALELVLAQDDEETVRRLGLFIEHTKQTRASIRQTEKIKERNNDRKKERKK